MIKLYTATLTAFLLTSTFVFGQNQSTQDVFNMGLETITIDGDAADVAWDLVPAINIEKQYRQEQPSLNSATWKATWNDEGIYFLIEVDDDAWLPSWMSNLADWQSDKIELYIDCTNPQKDGGGAAGGLGNWQVAPNFSQNNQGVETEFRDGIKYADTYDAFGKYTIEYWVPFTALPDNNGNVIDPYITETIGFDVTVIDLDDVNVGRNRMVWSNTGNIDESWNSMDDVGLITFVGESSELNARFSASNTTIGPGATVAFSDHSTGTPTTWLWDFGDGNTSTEQNPTNTYINAGSYTVTLTVSNSDGTKTTTKADYITVTTENLPPLALFTVNTTSGKTNETIQFTDESMYKPTAWRWFFGDGSTSNEQNPKHVYTNPGVYTVTLNTTNENGSNAETKIDYITIVVGDAPNVNFEVDQQNVNEDSPVQFTDLSDLNPTEWYWDFGDGEDSEEQNPIHVYVHPGTYSVSLTATNSNGVSTLVKENFITVNNVNYTAINEFNGTVDIHPNPTNGVLNIVATNDCNSLAFFDLNGRKVYETLTRCKTEVIDVTMLEKGIYILKINAENSFQSKKIIVN